MTAQMAMQELTKQSSSAYWVYDLQGHKLLRDRFEKRFLGFFTRQYGLGKPVQSRMVLSAPMQFHQLQTRIARGLATSDTECSQEAVPSVLRQQ